MFWCLHFSEYYYCGIEFVYGGGEETVTSEEGEDVSPLPSHYQSRDWLLAE